MHMDFEVSQFQSIKSVRKEKKEIYSECSIIWQSNKICHSEGSLIRKLKKFAIFVKYGIQIDEHSD